MTAINVRHPPDRIVLSELRSEFGPAWRPFVSDRGRWWATTTSAEVVDYRGIRWTGQPDAVDADTPEELAAKLRARSAGG